MILITLGIFYDYDLNCFINSPVCKCKQAPSCESKYPCAEKADSEEKNLGFLEKI